jgi:hypothetical protein
MSCGECRFFESNPGTKGGWCRRFPPIAFVTGECGDVDTTWCVPYVGETEYCGEFRLKMEVKTSVDEVPPE